MIKGLLVALLVLVLVVPLAGCGKGKDLAKNYGVPDGLKLDVPSPSDGTWTNTARRAFTTPPTLSVGKLKMNGWLVEIHPVTWQNTNVCTYVWYALVCDYVPKFTGEVFYGYINPYSGQPDSNGNTRYTGKTALGQSMFYWDYSVPEKVYLNIDFFKNDSWSKNVLYR